MSLLRWPLLFCLIYGLLWTRARLLEAPSEGPLFDQPVLNTVLSEDNESQDSLSFAFQKLEDSQRSPGSIASSPVISTSESRDFEAALAEVQARHGDPQEVLLQVQRELARLHSDQVVERSILIREAYLSFGHDLSPEFTELLDDERKWLADKATSIDDPAALQGYVQEITRFSIKNAPNSVARKKILNEMVYGLAHHSQAILALRHSILEHAEWDLPEIVTNAPPEAQPYLRGHQR
jgi:hypothetical protein